MQIERLQRDTDPYTVYAMTSLTTTIGAAVPVILQKVCWLAAPLLLGLCLTSARLVLGLHNMTYAIQAHSGKTLERDK